MEKAMRILEQIPTAIPLAARVDGIYFAYQNESTLHKVEDAADKNKYPISERSVFQIKDEPNKEIPTNPQGWNYKKVEAPIKGKWLHVYKESYDGIYEEQIVEQILANEGGLITGPAGTGKSVILRNIKIILVKQEQKIKVCAYTHAAARQGMCYVTLQGRTLRDKRILFG